MKVPVDQIGPSGLSLTQRQLTDRDPWLRETLVDAGELRAPQGAALQLLLTRDGDQVCARGSVSLALVGPCSRCAEDVEFALDTAVDVALVPLEKQPQPLTSGEVRQQDIDLGAYVDGQIDVGSILHDEILLDMPSQVLCRDDCLGLCGQCGQNQNADACRCADAVDPMSPFAALAGRK